MHRFFQDIAEVFELPGMPGFLHRDDVAAAYTARTGHQVRDLDWYLVYAALRDGVVMSRIKRRMIHFGQDQVPEDPDDYVMHQASLHRMLDGSYDWGTPEGLENLVGPDEQIRRFITCFATKQADIDTIARLF